jgi:hypothetical protein
MPELTAIQAFFTTFGFPLGSLILILWAGARGDWVYGWYHRRTIAALEKDRDEWKMIALRGVKVAAKATSLTTQQTHLQDGA